MIDYMPGIELQTLREACHLSRDDVGNLCGVQSRTVKHWEQRNGGVPADVAAMMTAIDAQVQTLAEQMAQTLRAEAAGAGPVVLVCHTSGAKLRRYCPELARVPFGAYAAMLARVRWLVAPLAVRLVRFDAEGYEGWRVASGQPDTEAALRGWAQAVALPDQAKAHRGDQPPV